MAALSWARERLQQMSLVLKRHDSLEEARSDLMLAFNTPQALHQALYRTGMVGELAGRWDLQTEMRGVQASVEPDPFRLPFEEALAFWKSRKVVTAKKFKELSEEVQVETFRVAGVVDRRYMNRLHTWMGDAIEQGTDLYDFAREVDEAAANLGVPLLQLGHLRTVFDTNLAQAYASGRYQQMMESRKAMPVWVYDAQEDARTRPTHRAWDGVMARWDSPFWTNHYPPNGYNCRCTVRPLTEGEAREAGWNAEEDVSALPPPDLGFERSPALAQEARRVGDQVVAETLARGLQPSTMLDKRRLLTWNRSGQNHHQEAAMQALARSRDDQRVMALFHATGLVDNEAKSLLQQVNGLNLYPPGWVPDPKALQVEAHMYSQDVLATEALVRRLVHHPEFTRLRGTLTVQPKVTLLRDWDPRWDDLTEAFDRGLGRDLGDLHPVAWSSEVALVVHPPDLALLQQLLPWLEQQLQQGAGRNPVPLAWGTADVRAWGPHLKTTEAMAVMWANTRKTKREWTALTLSPDPLPGWAHHPVGLSAGLADFLRSQGGTP